MGDVGARLEDAGRLEAVGEACPRRLRAASRGEETGGDDDTVAAGPPGSERRCAGPPGRERGEDAGAEALIQASSADPTAGRDGPRRTRDWAAKRASRAGKGNGPTGFGPNTIGRFKIPFLI